MTHLVKTSTAVPDTGKAIVPTLTYRNAAAMADWLCDAYGFEKQRVVTDASGTLAHAQLAYGGSILFVAGVDDAKLERLVVHPDRIGGVETQACYLVVPDIDAHCARAAAKGAEIVSGIEGKAHGDRRYVTRDPEGHIWMFGAYDPHEGRRRAQSEGWHGARRGLRTPLLAAALAVLVASVAAGAWTFQGRLAALKADIRAAAVSLASREHGDSPGAGNEARHAEERLPQVQPAGEGAERKLAETRSVAEAALRGEREARSLMAQEMRAKEGLARKAQDAEDRAAQERAARESAERMAQDAADRAGRAQLAQATAERAAKEMAERLERERKARLAAEQSMQGTAAELAHERSARAASELAASELRAQLTAPGAGPVPQGILALRRQLDEERRVKEAFEQAAKDAKLQLVQEKYSHDATERALKQVEDRLEKTQDRMAAASCWACPSGAPCSRPN
jgi:uncharacterized glyoxalase superfamily protein PhnB